MRKINGLLLILICSTLVVSCGENVVAQESTDNIEKQEDIVKINTDDNTEIDENSTGTPKYNDEEDNKSKNDWIEKRLNDKRDSIIRENIIEMPFSIEINNINFKVPIKGSDLIEANIEFNKDIQILADTVSFGDTGRIYENGFNKYFELGFLNNSLEAKSSKDCYIESLNITDDSVALSNLDNTKDIKVGTSLKDILNILNEMECNIAYEDNTINNDRYKEYLSSSEDNSNEATKNRLVLNNDNWEISLEFVNESKVDWNSESNCVPDKLKEKLTSRFNYYDISILGNYGTGVTDIKYQYSIADANEYSKRYRDMYE